MKAKIVSRRYLKVFLVYVFTVHVYRFAQNELQRERFRQSSNWKISQGLQLSLSHVY